MEKKKRSLVDLSEDYDPYDFEVEVSDDPFGIEEAYGEETED